MEPENLYSNALLQSSSPNAYFSVKMQILLPVRYRFNGHPLPLDSIYDPVAVH